MIIEYCIDEINDMIFAAYAHGGDPGGPYGSESQWIQETIKNFLMNHYLTDKYEYKECNRKYNNCQYFKVPQIVKKESIKNQTYGWE